MVKFTQLKVYMGNELVFTQDINIHSDSVKTNGKEIVFDAIELVNGEKITDEALVFAIHESVENDTYFEFSTKEGFTFSIN